MANRLVVPWRSSRGSCAPVWPDWQDRDGPVDRLYLGFSSTSSTNAFSGAAGLGPTPSRTFAANWGSVDRYSRSRSRAVSIRTAAGFVRWSTSPCPIRPRHCPGRRVQLLSAASSLFVTTCSTSSSVIDRGRLGRGSVRSPPVGAPGTGPPRPCRQTRVHDRPRDRAANACRSSGYDPRSPGVAFLIRLHLEFELRARHIERAMLRWLLIRRYHPANRYSPTSYLHEYSDARHKATNFASPVSVRRRHPAANRAPLTEPGASARYSTPPDRLRRSVPVPLAARIPAPGPKIAKERPAG